MSESLLALRWNNHRSTFFHVLNSIKQKEIYSDATIACDGKFYPVHKLVLATCSEYFEAMFSRTQCKHPIIVLKDIGHEEVEALLNYMYIGEVNVVQNDLAGLIKAAECLRIKGLAVPDEDNSNTTKNSTALLRKHYDNATTRPSVVEDESPRPHKRRKRDKSEEAQDRVGTSPAVVASPLNTPVARQEGNENIQRNNSQETNTLSGDRCQDLPDTESSQMYAKVVMSEPSIKREVSDDVPHDLESSVPEEQHLLQGDYSYEGKLSSSAQISEVETKLEPTDYGSTQDPNLAPLPGTSIAHGVWQTGEEMSLGSMGPLEASGGSEVLLSQGGQQQQQPGFTPSQQMYFWKSQTLKMDITFVESEKGKRKLCLDGYLYIKDRSVNNKIYWKCDMSRKIKCFARVITVNDTIQKQSGNHNHAGDAAKAM
ncbi:uncharacterized protein LOC143027676 isoform X3 [Oratosquilla oratoria]|uniref:uncharacterized protein LOC143027676 isoform X3 n=1 Tax=Oratosquilla oratoria TaxID=337810 RepID=UPI003F75D899